MASAIAETPASTPALAVTPADWPMACCWLIPLADPDIPVETVSRAGLRSSPTSASLRLLLKFGRPVGAMSTWSLCSNGIGIGERHRRADGIGER